MKKAWVLSYPRTHSEDSDQTGRMPRLIWVFSGRTATLLVLSWGGSIVTGNGTSFFFIPRQSLKPMKTKISHNMWAFGKGTLTLKFTIWASISEFGTYRLCEQRRFRRACASAQPRQNLRCSLIQAVGQEEPSDRKPDPWPLWMAGHAQLKFVMTECSKTQSRLTGLIL